MNGFKSPVAIVAAAVVVLAIGVSATVAGITPPWLQALEIRSEALNKQHSLGEFANGTSGTDVQAYRRALMIRSEALNRQHGLGRYARNPASADEPQWLRALIIRSDALNRQHKLGEYAPGS